MSLPGPRILKKAQKFKEQRCNTVMLVNDFVMKLDTIRTRVGGVQV